MLFFFGSCYVPQISSMKKKSILRPHVLIEKKNLLHPINLCFHTSAVFYSAVNPPLGGDARSAYQQGDIVSSPGAGSRSDALRWRACSLIRASGALSEQAVTGLR